MPFLTAQSLIYQLPKNDQTNDNYLKKFQARMTMLDNYDANIVSLVLCFVEEMLGTTMDLVTEDEMKKAKEYVLK